MKVCPGLKQVLSAQRCGCSIKKQNESGMVLGIALLLGVVVLLVAAAGSIHTNHHMNAVNADMDRIERGGK